MPVKGGVMSPAEKGRSLPPPNPASYSVPGLLRCDHAGVHWLPTREEPAIPPEYVRSDARAVVNAVAKQRQSRGRIMRIAAATLLTIASTAAFFVLERTELAGAGPVALPGRHHAAEGP